MPLHRSAPIARRMHQRGAEGGGPMERTTFEAERRPLTVEVRPLLLANGECPHYSASELETNATWVPSGDHDGTLIVPWPP